MKKFTAERVETEEQRWLKFFKDGEKLDDTALPDWMNTEEAKTIYKRRKELVEPSFGIIKEQMGMRRFLLRGLANVKTEARLLATAFNLRTT